MDEQNLALQPHGRIALRNLQSVLSQYRSVIGRCEAFRLAQALAACAAGDVLIVWKLDRLGRTPLDLVDWWKRRKPAIQVEGAGR